MIEVLEIFAEAQRQASLRSRIDIDLSLDRRERVEDVTAEWIAAEAKRLEAERSRRLASAVAPVRAPRNQATEAVRAYQRAYYREVRRAALPSINEKRREAYRKNAAAADAQRERVRRRYWEAKAQRAA